MSMPTHSVMSRWLSSSFQKDEIANRLLLDIKALVLLSRNESELATLLGDRILGSHDEQVVKFISMLRPKQQESRLGSFLIGIGELVFASILSVAGISLMAPSLLGLQSPHQLLDYFRQLTLNLSDATFSNPILPALVFLLALSLLLSAFYLLRGASSDLKNAGIIAETSL